MKYRDTNSCDAAIERHHELYREATSQTRSPGPVLKDGQQRHAFGVAARNRKRRQAEAAPIFTFPGSQLPHLQPFPYLSTYLLPTFSILRILPQLERPQRPPYATIRGNWISVFSGRTYNSEPRVLPTLSRLNVTESEEANWGVLSITHRFTPLS
jgi:hypothetical protein